MESALDAERQTSVVLKVKKKNKARILQQEKRNRGVFYKGGRC